ncbi:splicing factor C9orf78 homolog [Hydractinia symbiolongicarpus]|uniref:splicing factor C9orf78 homolog n=1 Tax=Hydractinia symbiolongicarpus TaxID=13093 RepID=UPI00254EB1A8|nr:splicing factor C9orf78 homolog [Hydractinia symbiolongicarpus]
MSKKRNYRRKQAVHDDEDEEEADIVLTSIEERKELQKFRSRPKGVSAESLLVGKKVEIVPETKHDDPFKLKSGGGLTEMSVSKERDLTSIGTNFSSETNQRDEDVELLKYIEEGLRKKKGEQTDTDEERALTKEDLLYQLPDNINVKSKIMKSEEMLSSQMLSGIPEVDLGIEAKIKNIEATEEAKMKILEDSKNQKQQTSFVPTNMASNFMHHSRFYDEKQAFDKEKRKEQQKKLELQNSVVDKGPTVGGEIVENAIDTKFMKKVMSSNEIKKRNKPDTTDDYMFEKFKKRAKEGGWR